MKKTLLFALVILVALGSALGAEEKPAAEEKAPAKAQAPAVVKAIKIKETRIKDLAPKKEGSFGWSEKSELILTLEVTGAVLEKATHYGKLMISTQKDDKGADLPKPAGTSFNDPSKDFIKIDRKQMYFSQKEKPTDRIKFDLKLGCPPRQAGAIAVMEGELKVLVGEQIPLLFPGIKKKEGQKLEHGALKEAWLKMDVLDVKNAQGYWKPKDPAKALQIQVTGDINQIMEITLVDGAGKEVKGLSKWWSSSGGKTTYTFQTQAPMADDISLKALLATGQKEVKIPFKLEGIPLP